MFCTSCGSQVPDGTTFCPNCGAQMPVANAPEMPQTPAPAPMPAPSFQQPDQQAGPQQFPGANQVNPAPGPVVTNNGGNLAGMPNTTTAIILIVVGFICGIIWGVIGLTQYKPMKNAIAMGDAVTANKKFNVIKIATIIGIVINVLFIIGNMNAGQ